MNRAKVSRPEGDVAPLAEAALWMFAVMTALVTAAFLAGALALSEPDLARRALMPGVLSCLGVWQLVRRRYLPVTTLVTTAVLVAVQVEVFGPTHLETVAIVGLAVVGMAAGIFVLRNRRRWSLPFMGCYALFLGGTVLFWHRADAFSADGVVSAFTAAIAFLFGALMLRRLESATFAGEQRYRSLFNHAPVSVWEEDFSAVGELLEELRSQGIRDLRGYLETRPEEVLRAAGLIRVKDVNEAAVRLVQAVDRAELIGPIPASDDEGFIAAVIEQLVAIWEGREALEIELDGHTLTGRPLRLVLRWTVPRTGVRLDLANVVVTITDVTRERRHATELEALVRSKDQFVATVSHELRTPMTAVVGIAAELRDHDFPAAETAELHEMLAEQSGEMAAIVEDLLVAARADIGKVRINPGRTDLRAAVDEVLATLRAADRVQVSGNGAAAYADPVRVRQILRNLLTNAFRYGGDTVEVAVWGDEHHSAVVVMDNGSGVESEARERIFEAYHTGNGSDSQPGSVGLGLTVSRTLARLMNGDLDYRYVANRSIFELSLPTAD